TARAHAAGEEVRTVIAGYHWFTDWGRDTMISLEGLTLTTGRSDEAGFLLRTFAHYVRDGLIPNMFPEGQKQGLYHTADATLWFFHAVNRYVEVTGDHTTLHALVPTLIDIADHHLKGTRFGIGVDGGEQGDGPACRPNQVFAVALKHPVLDPSRWGTVVDVVRERLLTPVGLRSLAPGHPDYKSRYFGDLRARDAAYHQGTVWAWLIGPYIDAWLRLHPDKRTEARQFLQGLVPHLGEACIGSVSEIF